MNIKPNFEQVKLSDNCLSINGQTKIECNTGIESNSIAKVLGISKKVSLIGAEVINGQVKYSGKAVFCLVYENQEGEILKHECGVDFSDKEEKECVKSNFKANISLNIEKATINLSNSTASIGGIVNAEINLHRETDVNLLTGGENLFFKKEEIEFVKGLGERSTSYPIEEEFEINCSVKEILMHNTQAIVTSAQSGVGCIIVDGEVILKILILQKQENSDILKESKILPFRLEIECEEAMPTMSALAKAIERSTKLDVLVDEEKNKSIIKVSVDVDVKGEVYDSVNLSLVVDAYSSDCEVELASEDFSYYVPLATKTLSTRTTARGRLNSSLEAGMRLLCTQLEGVNVASKQIENGSVVIDGTIEAKGLVKDIENKVTVMDFEGPFSLSVDASCGENDCVELDIAIEDFSARFVSTEEVELDATLRVAIVVKKQCKMKLITNLTEGEEKKENTSAISVYIPIEGEDLWTVSKRLNTCPEKIMELNKDLEFPLTGNERILVYRQIKKEY